jgi:hypothetical protein
VCEVGRRPAATEGGNLMTAPDREALKRIAAEANKLFVVPLNPDRLLTPVETLTPSCPGHAAPTVASFCANIRSIIATTGLPYVLALSASHDVRYQGMRHAAELEAVLDGHDLDSLDLVAEPTAKEHMHALAISPAGVDSLNLMACQFLVDLAESSEIREGAIQLLLQGAVLTWTALEGMSRDLFRGYLNSDPTAYAKLLAVATVRKRFDLDRLSIERIAEVGFDLSDRLGDLLVEDNDLADLPGIKSIYSALFPDRTQLHAALDDKELWILYQRRCLIVHRRAVVDRRYHEASGDDLPIGTRLLVTPVELNRYVTQAVRVGAELVEAVSAPAITDRT